MVSVLAFFLWSMFVSIINGVAFDNVNILKSFLYNFRHIEYFFIFFIGCRLPFVSLISILKVFVVYEFVLVVIQKFGFFSFATRYNVIERQVGSTSGPWELAVMISLPLFLFLYLKEYKYFILAFFILISTGSRITLAAALIVMLILYINNLKSKDRVNTNALLFIFLLSFIPLIFYFDFSFFIQKFTSVLSIKAQSGYYLNSPVSSVEFSMMDELYIKDSIAGAQGDASAFSRFSRWILALNVLISHGPIFYFLGLGSSFFGDALDGAYLRLLVTNGLVGLFLFLNIYYKLYKRLALYKFMSSFLIVYLISGLFIDVFYSLKINIIFWLTVGALCNYEKNSDCN
ncbi:hypothetical protein NQU96_21505 [Pseudoalteromonas elyakovii]|nr:hypothetical protein [Pseudoalteromonas elyakovii]